MRPIYLRSGAHGVLPSREWDVEEQKETEREGEGEREIELQINLREVGNVFLKRERERWEREREREGREGVRGFSASFFSLFRTQMKVVIQYRYTAITLFCSEYQW